MLRLLSLMGMGGTFLMISPGLRMSLTNGLGQITHQMDLYSPWSYIGFGLLLLLALFVSMYRGAQPQ